MYPVVCIVVHCLTLWSNFAAKCPWSARKSLQSDMSLLGHYAVVGVVVLFAVWMFCVGFCALSAWVLCLPVPACLEETGVTNCFMGWPSLSLWGSSGSACSCWSVALTSIILYQNIMCSMFVKVLYRCLNLYVTQHFFDFVVTHSIYLLCSIPRNLWKFTQRANVVKQQIILFVSKYLLIFDSFASYSKTKLCGVKIKTVWGKKQNCVG